MVSSQLNEERIINDLYPNPDTMSYEQLIELGEKIGTVSRGLQQESINKIRKVKYLASSLGKIIDSQEKCSICFEDFIKGEEVKWLKCNHLYHEKCINYWLEKEKKCPFCKAELS